MGSDWNVSTADPLLEMEIAVNRVHRIEGLAHPPLLPEERLTLDEAIHAFTMGSAFVNHHDDTTGSLSVGKLADLVVLDRDLFDRARRARSATPGSWPRSSRASRCSRTRALDG